MTTFTPTSADEVVWAVAWALAQDEPLEIVGHGSKRGIGRPPRTEHVVDTSSLSGVTLYEPEELVLSARAGTPLAEIEALVAAHGQELAFEPPDFSALLGTEPGRGTMGGVLATNFSGPRRLKAGAVRDHILGVSVVSGRGEMFKSGGRVVKNVTGYDLSKLMAGSWGTLGVVTDLTFKVLPAAETELTLALRGLGDDAATAAMALALGSSAEVSAAAHLPYGLAARVAGGMLGNPAATLLRLEGFGPSVQNRAQALRRLLAEAGPLDELPAETSKAVWRDVRDCMPFADNTERPVWRVSLTPTEAHRLVLALRMEAAADAFYDWQGGLVWLRMEAEPESEVLRGLLARFGGGHATLIRAAPAVRAATPVFQPQPPALAALSRRLKDQFDSKGILNPGRMR